MIKRFVKRMLGLNSPSNYGAPTTKEVEEMGRIMSEGFTSGLRKGLLEMNIKFKVLFKPAEAGDFIRVTNAWSSDAFYKNGDILTVVSDANGLYGGEKGVYVIKPRTKSRPKSERFILDTEYEVVAQVDRPKASEYTTVDRPAEAGDFIRIVAAENTLGKYEEGDILVVDGTTKPEYIGIYVDDVGIPGSINPNGFIDKSEFVVIEGAPLREEEEFVYKLPTPDHSEILNDNLIRRIAELEDIVEMLSDDIVMLDERTQSLARKHTHGRGK